MHESLLVGVATVFVLGLGAQWIGWRFRLPSILLLLRGHLPRPGRARFDARAELQAIPIRVISESPLTPDKADRLIALVSPVEDDEEHRLLKEVLSEDIPAPAAVVQDDAVLSHSPA